MRSSRILFCSLLLLVPVSDARALDDADRNSMHDVDVTHAGRIWTGCATAIECLERIQSGDLPLPGIWREAADSAGKETEMDTATAPGDRLTVPIPVRQETGGRL